jgi:ABC-type lipoprotein export system ATPase subunit
MNTSAPPSTIISVENASRVFRMGDVEVTALMDAYLEIYRGEFIVVLGPSGSGKSTLLNLIGGCAKSKRFQTPKAFRYAPMRGPPSKTPS